MEASPFSIENILKPPTTESSEDAPSNSRTTEALTLAEKLAGKMLRLQNIYNFYIWTTISLSRYQHSWFQNALITIIDHSDLCHRLHMYVGPNAHCYV